MSAATAGFDISDTFKVIEHKIPCQHIREYPQATAFSQEDVLYLAVKQYVPLDNVDPSPGHVSIVSAHANGIPKEAYEPLWVEVYQAARKSGVPIRGIWMADVAHQGASGLMNEKYLGNDPSAFDHSRDLMLMINHCRDSLPQPIFGVGHSMGATQLIHLSLMHPRIFQGLFLVEPIVFPYSGKEQGRYPAALVSLRRRDTFPTRDAAVVHFQHSRLFQAWDPRAFDMWIKHGLREGPPGSESSVTLTTPKSQELCTFVRPIFSSKSTDHRRELYPDLPLEASDDTLFFYHPEPVMTFHNLPYLRPPILYAFCKGSHHVTHEMRTMIAKKTGTGVSGSGGMAKGRVRTIVVDEAGHVVPMEHPRRLAGQVLEWLQVEYEKWASEEEARKLQLHGQDGANRRGMSQTTLALLGAAQIPQIHPNKKTRASTL